MHSPPSSLMAHRRRVSAGPSGRAELGVILGSTSSTPTPTPVTRTAHVERIAVVEVQAIMQFLDPRSLLQFARCSRRLYSDADTDIVWQWRPPFELVIDGSTASRIEAGVRRSLLSHGLFRVVCSSTGFTSGCIDAVLAVPHLRELIDELLDERGCIADEEWTRILTHEAMRELHVLCVHEKARLPIRLLPHLTQLDSLEFSPLTADATTADMEACSSFASLTSLTVHAPPSPFLDVLPRMVSCDRLTHLSLVRFPLADGEFQRLLTSPNLSRLEHLRLGWFGANLIPAAEYAAAFAALTSLRRLSLHFVRNIDQVLVACIPHASSTHLETLEIDDDNSMGAHLLHRIPSVGAVETVLAQAPSVHLTLRIRHPKPHLGPTQFNHLDPQRFTLILV